MKWERVQAKNWEIEGSQNAPSARVYVRRGAYGPGRRWGHTCNAVQKKGQTLLYVFGGYGAGDDSQTNDVHVFDTAEQIWSKPKVKGTPPRPRDSHSCTTVGERLFVFGGTDGTKPLKDLHIFDTGPSSWISPIAIGKGPSAREGHSAALVGHRLFVFGGCGRSPRNRVKENIFNDLYILDTISLKWRKAATRGTAPAPRDGHTCSAYRDKIIVVGGQDLSNSTLADVFMLDANTLVWNELGTFGQNLAPRSGHTAVVLGEYLFVFGGYDDDQKLLDDLHVLNIESGLWTKEPMIGEAPSARFSSAGDCTELEKGILLFGGCNENLDALDDMFFLDTENGRVMN